jgi:RimJ/RimL family protein N-acetyltransferase
MTDRQITTDRLVLRPVDPAVARQIVDGDLSAVRPGDGWPHADSLDGLRLSVDCDQNSSGWLVALQDGTVIGDCGWKGGPGPDGTTEIGYGLAAPYRGRGYGREAVTALVDWLLGAGGVRRVIAETRADNLPSRRVLERAGFHVTHTDGADVYYARESAPS